LEDSEWTVPEVDEDSISEESTESTQPFDDIPEENGVQDITPFVNNNNLKESYKAVDVDILPEHAWDIANQLVNIKSGPTTIPVAIPLSKASTSKSLNEMIPAIKSNNQMLNDLNAQTVRLVLYCILQRTRRHVFCKLGNLR